VQGLAGRYVVVEDGRVDGQAELLSSLRSRDQRLGSAAGPATLLLNAYLAWGEGFMQRVLGDWAFALWDRVDRRLLLARSPLGLRPLYYRIDEGRIVFGSEIGQILALDGMPR